MLTPTPIPALAPVDRPFVSDDAFGLDAAVFVIVVEPVVLEEVVVAVDLD